MGLFEETAQLNWTIRHPIQCAQCRIGRLQARTTFEMGQFSNKSFKSHLPLLTCIRQVTHSHKYKYTLYSCGPWRLIGRLGSSVCVCVEWAVCAVFVKFFRIIKEKEREQGAARRRQNEVIKNSNYRSVLTLARKWRNPSAHSSVCVCVLKPPFVPQNKKKR